MNFLETLHEWVGESECPPKYIDWVGRSMIAACMGNRLFVNMRIGALDIQVYPNLYVILVGPSVGYKSFALKLITDLIGDNQNPKAAIIDRMNVFNGRTTAQGLYEQMRTKIRRTREDGTRETINNLHRGQLYLINDELVNNFGLGERADTMVTTLTEFFLSQSFSDRTRVGGSVHIENLTANWIAATTPEWMRLSIKREHMLGGFLGRVIVVSAKPTKKRIFRSERSPRWNMLESMLRARLNEILLMGEDVSLPFIKTPEAEALEEAWYMSRVDPEEDDPTISHWRRQRGLILKLAANESMILGNEPYITEMHMQRGIELVNESSEMLKEAVPKIATNNPQAEEMLNWMRLRGDNPIQRTDLNRAALSHCGWRADELDRWVETWERAGLITVDRKPPNQGGTKYYYKGKKR